MRADNDRAQQLYRRYGFAEIGIRRGYYQPSGADALVMRALGPDPAAPDGTQADPARDARAAGRPSGQAASRPREGSRE